MTDHKCNTDCEGANKYNGCAIKCKSCSLNSYLFCLISNSEIDQLVKLLGIDRARGDKTDTIGNALKTIFANNSMISFKCPTCYNNASIIENENKSLKKKNTELQNKIRELEKGEATNGTSATTNTVTHEFLESKMKQLEDKIVKKIGECMKTNDRHENNKTLHENESEQHDLSKQNNITNGKKSLLKPPKSKLVDRSIYEIHVSKFSNEITPNIIVEHIMENTSIPMRELFKVEQMRSRKMNNARDYATFKISTFSKETYTAIMNRDVWEPEYEARDFELRQPKMHGTPQRPYENKGQQQRVTFDTPGRGGRDGGFKNGRSWQKQQQYTPAKGNKTSDLKKQQPSTSTPMQQQYFLPQHPYMFYQMPLQQPPPNAQPQTAPTQIGPTQIAPTHQMPHKQ